MELSKIQQEIVYTSKNNVIVHSCAGSGKTRCLVERLKYLLEIKKVDPDKIVAITFTNAAAGEIYDRVKCDKSVFIGTVHGYANRLLLRHGIDTSKFIQEEKFDKLLETVQYFPECIQNIDYLLLDEGQDSTNLQFNFILNVLKPKNWMIFADIRQSIYGFNNADPDYIIYLMKQPDVYVYDLNENYRNGNDILEFAKRIIETCGEDYYDNSICLSNSKGKVMCPYYNLQSIVKSLIQYHNTKEEKYKYGNWFILVRTNSQLEQVKEILDKNDIPNFTFKRAELSNEQLNEKLKQDAVKVLTIHTAKGLESENVIVIGAHFSSKEEKRLCYVAATRARNLLVFTITKSKNKPKTKKYNDMEYWGG